MEVGSTREERVGGQGGKKDWTESEGGDDGSDKPRTPDAQRTWAGGRVELIVVPACGVEKRAHTRPYGSPLLRPRRGVVQHSRGLGGFDEGQAHHSVHLRVVVHARGLAAAAGADAPLIDCVEGTRGNTAKRVGHARRGEVPVGKVSQRHTVARTRCKVKVSCTQGSTSGYTGKCSRRHVAVVARTLHLSVYVTSG